MKFVDFALLTATWVFFWRSVAHKFDWSGMIRGLIPTVLFMVPLAALHASDQSLGNEKGDWAAGIVILGMISFACVKVDLGDPPGTRNNEDSISLSEIEASNRRW
jgi:Na+/proline symporter